MKIENIMFGFVMLAIMFIAFSLGFNTPEKEYIPESDLNTLEDLGKTYVEEANPSFVGQIFFYISSFWTILKTTFSFIFVGSRNLIFDVGGMFSIPYRILGLLSGAFIFILALYVLDKLRGGK